MSPNPVHAPQLVDAECLLRETMTEMHIVRSRDQLLAALDFVVPIERVRQQVIARVRRIPPPLASVKLDQHHLVPNEPQVRLAQMTKH